MWGGVTCAFIHRISLGMDKWFHPTLNLACDNVSKLGLKLIHISKGSPENIPGHDILHIVNCIYASGTTSVDMYFYSVCVSHIIDLVQRCTVQTRRLVRLQRGLVHLFTKIFGSSKNGFFYTMNWCNIWIMDQCPVPKHLGLIVGCTCKGDCVFVWISITKFNIILFKKKPMKSWSNLNSMKS